MLVLTPCPGINHWVFVLHFLSGHQILGHCIVFSVLTSNIGFLCFLSCPNINCISPSPCIAINVLTSNTKPLYCNTCPDFKHQAPVLHFLSGHQIFGHCTVFSVLTSNVGSLPVFPFLSKYQTPSPLYCISCSDINKWHPCQAFPVLTSINGFSTWHFLF